LVPVNPKLLTLNRNSFKHTQTQIFIEPALSNESNFYSSSVTRSPASDQGWVVVSGVWHVRRIAAECAAMTPRAGAQVKFSASVMKSVKCVTATHQDHESALKW